MSVSNKLADSLNVMYKDVVNEGVVAPINSLEYKIAEDYVNTHYSKLNDSVLEFLAAFMCVHQGGKVCFYPSTQVAVDLHCKYGEESKVVGFNDLGAIVKDEVYRETQKGE